MSQATVGGQGASLIGRAGGVDPQKGVRHRWPDFGRALAALLGAAALAGCTLRPGAGEGGTAPSPAVPEVITTIFPMTALTQAVAGDCAAVSQLLPPGAGPHGYRPSPADLVRLRQGRLLVMNGLGMEAFLDKLIAGGAPEQLVVVDASKGITPMPMGRPAEHGQDHADHGHGLANPHVWLDPKLATQQLATIRDALVALDPSCAEGYRSRAAAFSERLARLDGQLARVLAPYRGRTVVTQHDVAPYLARRYGLDTVFLVPEPEMAASPADLRRVDTTLRSQALHGVLVDPGQPPGALAALAGDRNLALVSFDPLESAAVAAAAAPDHFLAVMERNGDALVQVLQAGAGTAASVD